MKCVVVTHPGELEVKEVAKPVPSPYQALVKTEMVALCNSTDSKLLNGHFPGVDTYPLALGHETVGIVEAVGSKVESFKPGERVIGGLNDFGNELAAGWGGFSEYVIANDHDVMVKEGIADEAHGWANCFEIQNAIPASVPAEEGVLACTWREVLGSFKEFGLQPGKKILVFGAGPVGLSFVKLGSLFGLSQIDIVDREPAKLEVAKSMGALNTYLSAEVERQEFLTSRARSYDTVIDAVGLESIVNNALELVKFAGDVCVYGVMTKNPLFEISRAPLNFNLHMHQWPTRSEERRSMGLLAEWIASGKLKAEEFVSHRFKISEIAEAFEAVRRNKAIKVTLTF